MNTILKSAPRLKHAKVSSEMRPCVKHVETDLRLLAATNLDDVLHDILVRMYIIQVIDLITFIVYNIPYK